jgi:hypothetical protein
MHDQVATVDGRRCQFLYIILSHVSRLGIIPLMYQTGKFPKCANHHLHAISERSWVDNMERRRSCLKAFCRRRALIKCLLVFSFGICWCDARKVCGPLYCECPCEGVHVIARSKVSRCIRKDTVSLIFASLLLTLVPHAVVMVR